MTRILWLLLAGAFVGIGWLIGIHSDYIWLLPVPVVIFLVQAVRGADSSWVGRILDNLNKGDGGDGGGFFDGGGGDDFGDFGD